MFCSVCRDAGKTKEEYTNHYVRESSDPRSKVVCPTLMTQKCHKCHTYGHTRKYCPITQEKRALMQQYAPPQHTTIRTMYTMDTSVKHHKQHKPHLRAKVKSTMSKPHLRAQFKSKSKFKSKSHHSSIVEEKKWVKARMVETSNRFASLYDTSESESEEETTPTRTRTRVSARVPKPTPVSKAVNPNKVSYAKMVTKTTPVAVAAAPVAAAAAPVAVAAAPVANKSPFTFVMDTDDTPWGDRM